MIRLLKHIFKIKTGIGATKIKIDSQDKSLSDIEKQRKVMEAIFDSGKFNDVTIIEIK